MYLWGAKGNKELRAEWIKRFLLPLSINAAISLVPSYGHVIEERNYVLVFSDDEA